MDACTEPTWTRVYPLTPQERRRFGTPAGELVLLENPEALPHYEVWAFRVDWQEWRRVYATEDLDGAEGLFAHARDLL